MPGVSTPPFVNLPDCVESTTIEGPTGDLACLAAFPPGPAAGSAVMIPGLTGSKEDFIALLPGLHARGWAVLALDLRGQCESACPQGASFEMEDFADDAVAAVMFIRERTGQPVHLLGHSLGGLIVRRVALRIGAPSGRGVARGSLGSLTLLGSGPAALPKTVQHQIEPLIKYLPATALEVIWTAKEAMDRVAGQHLPSPAVASFLRRRFLANNPHALRAKADLLCREPDLVADLRRVLQAEGLPANVVYGAHDDAWPPSAQDDMARRLGARQAVIPHSGHSPNAERPEITTAVLDQLWRGPGGAVAPRPSAADASAMRAAGREADGLFVRIPFLDRAERAWAPAAIAGILAEIGLAGVSPRAASTVAASFADLGPRHAAAAWVTMRVRGSEIRLTAEGPDRRAIDRLVLPGS